MQANRLAPVHVGKIAHCCAPVTPNHSGSFDWEQAGARTIDQAGCGSSRDRPRPVLEPFEFDQQKGGVRPWIAATSPNRGKPREDARRALLHWVQDEIGLDQKFGGDKTAPHLRDPG